MVTHPLVSVLVAAYNAGSSIARCIDGIIAQKLQDLELIIVNDGSTDDTGRIADAYARSDDRITVIHQKNCGVSAARQTCLNRASGIFSIFVDADDWIEPDMLQEMYQRANESGADMVICDIVEEFGDHQDYRRQDPGTSDHLVIQRKMLNELHAGMVNKLIRHQLYEQFGIRFPERVNCCEDQFVMIQLLSHPMKVAYVAEAYYHYDKTMNTGSITNQWHSRPIKERLLFLENVEPLMKGAEHQEAFAQYAAKRVFDSTFAGKDEESDYRQIYSNYKTLLDRSSLPWHQKLCCRLRYAGLGWIVRIYRHFRYR